MRGRQKSEKGGPRTWAVGGGLVLSLGATVGVLAAAVPPAPAKTNKAPVKAVVPAAPNAASKKTVSDLSYPASFPGPLLQKFLQGPMKEVEEIVFAARVPGRDHWYVNFGNYSDHSETVKGLARKFEEGVYWGYGEGGRLCRLNLRTGELKVLLDSPKGGVRDPQLSYDGKKILFSYRKPGEHPYHLYEINLEGTGLRQLTDGPDDDFEPTYCPDGSIVFVSSRSKRFVNCWYTRVATLHRCDADGRNIRMLSSNVEHDNTPWPLPDGRLLYMRWEYVDRSQLHYHHLWTTNPDGTGQTVFYGNMHGGYAMLDAKPIPGTTKVAASFSPGHGRPEHLGYVTVLDTSAGPDELKSFRHISARPDWKDPWGFTEDCFLVAHAQGLFVMDGAGKAELIYRLPESDRHMECSEPRPVQARPREPVIPSRVNLKEATGKLVLQDIYEGRNMAGVKRGAIKKMLVLQQLPKPVNFSGGMEPLTIGGSFTLAEVLGEVPVEPDGSAYLELPALRSLFFVALDERDISVKRMHSFVTVQPGETTGCVGCHEQRTQAALPRPNSLMALRKPPAQIRPIAGQPAVLDYPRDIQPILDRHCVSCHNPDKRDGKVDLCGDYTASYTISYWTMVQRGLISDARNQPISSRAPYSYGTAASKLLKYLDGSHYQARLSEKEQQTVRLWIETSATYPGTYAALGCGSYPVGNLGPVMQRCGACHSGVVEPKKGEAITTLIINGKHGRSLEPYANLSRPEKSYYLLAPLAKSAGGLGLCKETVFKDKKDPLYLSALAAITSARQRLLAGKRFDMPDFRPNPHYLREMQRYGILPKDLAPDIPVNPYTTDRAYWDSFYYRPPASLAGR